MNVIFIVHGSPQIGMGHIVRSLALATEFLHQGWDICFYSKYMQGIQAIKNAGFAVVEMPGKQMESLNGFYYGDKDELTQDSKFIKASLQQELPDIIALDSYNVSETYFLELKKLTKRLVYMDDLNLFPYPVDVLINGSAAADIMGYKKHHKEEFFFLGPSFAILREEFRHIPTRSKGNNIKNVLITTGGSDPFFMTEKILGYISREAAFQSLNFHVIIGAGFSQSSCKKFEEMDFPNIHFYKTPENMSQIMSKCELAITAGGSTVYELAACGVLMSVFCYADNQRLHIKVLENLGLLKYIGEFDKVAEKELYDAIYHWIDYGDSRNEIVKKLQSLVDGRGVERIVQEL